MARSRVRGEVRLVGVARRTRSALLVSTALQAVVVMVLTVPAGAQPAPNAQPTGGIVTGGAITIGQNSTSTNVVQSTQRGAVNWQSFDVGSQQTVNFQQPNAQAITLNQVRGPNPSQIAGKINANGQVVIVNQSGVTFYKGSQVNTAGLMVSASATDPKAFMAGGKIVFNQPGNPNARIINNGNITIHDAGLAALVAPGVANAGTITANLGHVVLAGAKTTTLDLYGDKMVSLNVTGSVTQAPDGGEALVTNTGLVRADGGTVQLTARAVDGVVTNLVSAGGKIQAETVGGQQGRITIDGMGGSITITGNIDATGRAAGAKGGKIGLLASDTVIVKSGAVVNASGKAGGGTIAIGTTLKRAAGGPSVTNAKMAKGVLVQQGATIAANASVKGKGGRVTVLSSRLTSMEGSISTMGGPLGGDGGFVEVSGGVLSLTGAVNVSAPNGLNGTLLLDPSDLDIVDKSAGGTNIDSELIAGLGTLAFSDKDGKNTPSSITADEINVLGATGNILIQATGTIDFQNTKTAVSISHDLTAQAGADLLVDRGVSISTTTNLSLTSGANTITGIALNAGSIALGVTGGAAGAATLSANALVLNAGSTGINLNDGSVAVTGLANLNALGGGVSQAAAGVLSAATLASTSGITGTVALAGSANAIGTIGSLAVTAGDFSLVDANAGNLTVTGPLTAGKVSLSNLAAGTVSVAGTLGATAGLTLTSGSGGIQFNTGHVVSGTTVDLSATGGGVTQVATGTITATSILQSTSGVTGTVALLGSSNAVASIGSFAVTGGDFTLINSANVANLAVIGKLTAGNVSISNSGTAGISVAGSIGATSGLILSSGSGGIHLNTGDILSGGTVDFSTLGGGVTQVSTGTISASTVLQSSSGVTGTVDLAGTANNVSGLGTFAVTAGDFTLVDNGNTGNLLINSPVTAGNISISDANTGTISLSGTLGATTTLVLSSGSGGIQLLDGDVLSGATVDLSAIGGGITQNADGMLTASSLLRSGTGVTGTVSLAGTLNNIASVGSFAVTTGDFNLVDSGNAGTVTISGPLSAGNVTITGVDMSITGLVTAAGTVDLIANAGSISETGTIDAGTLTGSTGGGAILTGASAAANQIATLGAFTATTGSIAVDTGLSLNVTGAVSATAGDVVLRSVGTGNTISVAATGSLEAVSTGTVSVRSDVWTLAAGGTVTGGLFEYAPDSATGLTVGTGGALADLTGIGTSSIRLGSARGVTSATGITLAANFDAGVGNGGAARAVDLQANGNIVDGGFELLNVTTLTGVANTGSVTLGNVANTVTTLGTFTATKGFTLGDGTDLTVAGVLSAGSATLTASSITLPGTITTGGSAVGSVSLTAKTTTIGGAGVITTGTLSGSAFTTVNLSGANQIGTLGSLTGTAISLNDGVALTINNTVSSSGTVSLTSGGLLTLSSGQTVTGTDVTLSGTALAIGGLVTTVGTADLIASTGTIGEAGTIVANTLIGSSGASALLTGTGNQIDNLGAFTATTGTLSLIDTKTLNVTGAVGATVGDVVLRSIGAGNTVDVTATGALAAGSTGTVSGRSDVWTLAAGGTVTGGLFEYAQDTAGVLKIGAGGALVDLTGIGTGAVRLGSAEGVTTANGLTLASNLDLGVGNGGAARPLDLRSTVSIDDGGNELLNVSTLSGVANGGSVSLNNIANTVSALGTFTIGTGFTFADSLDLTIANALSATSVSLTAPNLTISGTINTGGSLAGSTTLIANTGTISGAGAVVTGTLTGSAVGTVSLLGASAFGSLGAFTAAALSLNDTSSMDIVGAVSAAGTVALTSSGLLTVGLGESVTGTPVSLNGGTIVIDGLVTAGAGTLILTATTASITEDATGTLIAGMLTGSAAASASMAQTSNLIGTLGAFTSTAGFALTDNQSLLVNGPVNDTGTATTLALTTNTGDLTLFGDLTAKNAVALISAGTIGQTGGSISAVTLTGSAATSASLTSATNLIGTLAAFTANAGFALTNNQALLVNGAVTDTGAASTLALTTKTGGLTLTGSINATNTLDLISAGTISETGTIVAATLTGSAAAAASLTGASLAANQFGTLGAFTATSLTLNDGTVLAVAGTVNGSGGVTIDATGAMTIPGGITATTGNIVLLDGAAGGVTVNSGSVIATGQTISVGASALAITGTGTIVTNIFEFGPSANGGTVTLGGSGFTSGGISAALIRIGTVTGTVEAGSIVIAGFSNSNLPLELDATGAVTQTGALTNVSTLTGIAGSFTLTNAGNTIGQLGGGTFSTTGGGAISIVDSEALTLAGLVSAGAAGTVDISVSGGFNLTQGGGATLVAGVLTSGIGLSGNAILQGTANQIGTVSGLSTLGGTLTVVDSKDLTLTGLVSAGLGGGGTLDISTSGTAGVTQLAAGTLIAAVLTSAGGIAGSMNLQGGNTIGAISGLTAGGNLTVVNNQSLTLAGLVSAATVDITTRNAGTLTQGASGTLIASVLTSANGIGGNAILQGTSNQIGTIANFSVGGTLAVVDSKSLTLSGLVSTTLPGVVDISTSAGASVTQSPGARLVTTTLTSASGISGNLILQGTLNDINTISNLTVGGGTLAVVDSGPVLDLAGAVSAGTVDLTMLTSGSITQGSGATLTAGVLTSAGGIAGNADLQGAANKIGTIAAANFTGGLTVVNSQALALAGSVSVGSSGTVDITTTGAGSNVTQTAGDTLIAGLLTSAGGITGTVNLQGTGNQIGSVSGLTAAGLTIVDSKALTLAGIVSVGASGTVDITGPGVTQAAAATLTTGVLSSAGGIAGTAILQGTANAIGTISGFTATGSLVVVDNHALTVAGAVGASTGNVFLTTGTNTLSFAAAGSLGSKSGGTIGIMADSLANLGVVGATGTVNAGASGVFEYAPTTPSLTVTLGAATGPSLTTVTGITAGTLRIGQVSLPLAGTPTVNAAAIAITGAFDAKGAALELDSTGGVAQSAPLLNVSTLTGTATSYTLTDAGNSIGQLGGGTLTATTGTLAVVDTVALTIAGTVSAKAGNVFIGSGANTLTFASAASLVSQAGGRIGLQVGGLGNLGTTGATGVVNTSGGLFELAPGTAGSLLVLGGTSNLSVFNLTGINAGTLRFGAVTLPGSVNPVTTAGSILIPGVFDAKSTAVELDASGAVTETAPIDNVTTLTGTAASYTMTAGGNTIGQIGGGTLTATAGTIAIIDDIALTIAGTVKATAGNIFLQATANNAVTFAAGGSLISQSGGTIAIQADTIVNLGTSSATGVLNAGAAGLFELAPSSLIGETLGAVSGLSLANLTGITAGEVRVGAVTLPGSAAATTTATSIVVAGTFDAGSRKLDLDASGAVTQAAPLTNVTTLTGTAGSYTLTNAGNTIGQIGGGTLTATAGTIAIVDNSGLTIAGTINAKAGNVFLETAAGDPLTFAAGASVLSVSGGTIGIETDAVLNLGTSGATGVVNAGAAGLFEFAPTSLITETLGASGGSGLSLTNLTNITAGELRIGAVTLPGSVAPTVNATSIAVAGTFDLATVGTLDLEANGGISQTAPIVNLTSLIASTNGASGDINLGDTLNSIATIAPVGVTAGNFIFGDTPASGTFTVKSGQAIFANNVSMTVVGTFAVNGSVTAAGSPGNVILAASGGTADLLIGPGATIGAKGTASVSAGRNLTQSGGVINGGTVIGIAGGLLTLGATTSGTAVSMTGANIAITGLVTDGGAGTVTLVATTGTISETGSLIAGTLSGSSTLGATGLTGTNTIGTLGTFTAVGFTLNDGKSLNVTGAVNGGTASSATINDTAALTIAAGGSVSANAVSLQGTSITIAGEVTDGGSGTVTLVATTGTISETGSLIAGTLRGSSTLGATGLTGTNTIATLGTFTAVGFTLNDGAALNVTGAVNGGTASSATINDTAALTIAAGGSVSANAVSLQGTSITIPGEVTDGGSGTVTLVATTGTISETGSLIAGTLSGSSTLGATGLTGTNTIGTLGTFTAVGFTLNDGAALNVTGAVNGGTASSATINDTAALTIAAGGSVSANAVSLQGTSITIPGVVTDGGSGTVTLVATTGTISETGSLIAGTLSGSSTLGATGLTGTNTIATLGTFTAVGFTLNDGKSLNVTGAVNGGTASSATITDTAALTIAAGGSVSANAVSLQGTSITIPGEVTDGGSGTVTLVATTGTISETGSLIAGTLSGSSILGATGVTGTNTIATLGTFTAVGFTLNDGKSLNVTGAVNGGTASSATINDTAALTIAAGGSVSANAVSLQGTSITIPGEVTDGGSGTVTLVATTGTISETGSLIAGTLSGSSILGATGLTGTNTIATLGTFTAVGFTLNDGKSLNVTGAVNGGTASSATITDTAALTIAAGGSVSANAVSLQGTSITIPGEVTDGGSGTVTLVATTGTISETGSLIAGTLSGGSTLGATGLTGTNTIATLGTFTAVGFTLNDGKSLNVTGAVNGGTASSATINDTAALTIAAGGSVSANAVSLQGTSITIPGEVTDGGSGTVTLVATTGTISESGSLIAGTLSGSSTLGATDLTGTNTIGTLGTFTAVSFTLNDGAALTVSGAVNGGPAATITDGAALTIASGGSVSANAVSLQGTSITIPGEVTDGGSGTVSLVATTGTISETGSLIAGTLSGSSTLGATTLTSLTNQVGTLGTFTAASFALNDGAALTVAGVVNGTASATINDTAGLSIAGGGTVSATAIALQGTSIVIAGLVADGPPGTVSLTATNGTISETSTGTVIAFTLSGTSTGSTALTNFANQIDNVSSFTAAGFTLNDGTSLSVNGLISGGVGAVTIDDSNGLAIGGEVSATAISLTAANISVTGLVTDGGAGTVNLIANAGSITETGTIISGTLFGSSTGATSLTGTANQIANITTFTAAGFTLNDSTGLTVTGTINSSAAFVLTDTGNLVIAPGALINAASITVTDAGNTTIDGTVMSNGTGSITTNGGTLTLASSGIITSSTSVAITDVVAITLDGLLSAPRITVDNTGGTITVGASMEVKTGGQPRRPGSISASSLPSATAPNNGPPTNTTGIFFTTGAFIQTGTMTVTGVVNPTDPTVMRIDSTGTVSFGSPAGLVAPQTWLILAMNSASRATGAINVSNLDVVFSGQAGGTALTGTVNQLGGEAAAGESNIAPSTNSTFQINGCPIGSINCVLLTTAGIPAAPPLRDIVIGSIIDPTDDDDLLLPLVSDQEY